MRIVPRQEWGHTAPLGPPMLLPANEVWVHHSVTVATDDDGLLEPTDDPYGDMRRIEGICRRRFGRFCYSYAAHPNGTLMEGAGTTIGAHTAERNSTSFGVVLIGNYDQQDVTAPQFDAVVWLIRRLRDSGRLHPGRYPSGGHRDVKETACPGQHAYTLIPRIRDAVDGPTHEWDQMASKDEIKAALREVLTETLAGIEIHGKPLANRLHDVDVNAHLAKDAAAYAAGLVKQHRDDGPEGVDAGRLADEVLDQLAARLGA